MMRSTGHSTGEGLRPWPIADEVTAPFWEAARQRQLVLQRCAACERFRHPPSSHCDHCGSDAAEWVDVSGRGRVFSFIVDHRNMVPGFHGAYVVALVIPDEVSDDSVRLCTNLPDCPPESVRIGMPVTVEFEEVRPGIVLPQFIVSRPIDPMGDRAVHRL